MHHKPKKDQKMKHVCHLCSEKFLNVYKLKKHIRDRHEGRRPTHPCKLCKAGFFRKKLLNKHMAKLHKDGKYFQCPICPAPEEKFGLQKDFQEHTRYFHTNIKPYPKAIQMQDKGIWDMYFCGANPK